MWAHTEDDVATSEPSTVDGLDGGRAPELEVQPEEEEDVPFYKKVLAHSNQKDKGGFGPNWSSVDDYDIPTVLRKQMD